MPFFEYNQNNTYGVTLYDHKRGVTHHVIIEADTPAEADRIAEKHTGIYFDGVEMGADCPCCGDRFFRQLENEKGDPVPSIYGSPVSVVHVYEGMPQQPIAAYAEPEAYIHYRNGNLGVGSTQDRD